MAARGYQRFQLFLRADLGLIPKVRSEQRLQADQDGQEDLSPL
jgi:hypothetical protein